MQKQIDVVVKCPDCRRDYIQRVTGEYIGPRKRVPNYAPRLQDLCKEYGQTFEHGAWVGLMYCADCSVRRAPPALRGAVRKWVEEGESSL